MIIDIFIKLGYQFYLLNYEELYLYLIIGIVKLYH